MRNFHFQIFIPIAIGTNFQIVKGWNLTLMLIGVFASTFAQKPASIKEYDKVFKTYGFSDPDPIPKVDRIYPYFRFDGYTNTGVDKSWKVVELENDYISVMILPEIGGKIWAASEKSTGKPFLYYNHVVKFRDIAMRGPWTSGGIEANYGIIGHTPNCSTPVDYAIRRDLYDGSVSCFIGTLDLLTQTYWTIEVRLETDKAYFTTRSFWSNTSPLEQPYYTWMNAGIKASGNLEFVYPGTHYLGHDGSNKPWPMHENGKNISFYEQNNFGPYKSYHVFGKYTNFFGGFWHKENFGMGRYSPHEDKAGKKIWIWGLSQQGMIWENLLSDTDGQYVEVQSGRLFNQTDHTSTTTPFKHRGFAPYSTDAWTEYWFPVKGTQGFVAASPTGAMNVRMRPSGYVRVDISPLESRKDKLVIRQGKTMIAEKVVDLQVMKLFSDSVLFKKGESLSVSFGNDLFYNTDPSDAVLSRPVEPAEGFDWNSVQGLHLDGKEFIREREYTKAEEKLKACLQKDPNYLPALADLAMISYRNLEYDKALEYSMKALRVDTYDPAANFYYGLTSLALKKLTDARDGFDVAAMSPSFRGAALTELSRMELKQGQFDKAIDYAERALQENQLNVEAMQLLAVAHRVRPHRADRLPEPGMDSLWVSRLKFINPLNHFASFESYLIRGTPSSQKAFTSAIRHELATESYLDLAAWYTRIGRLQEAEKVLSLAPPNAEVLFWKAFLSTKLTGSAEKSLNDALSANATGVFPFRSESAEVFAWATGATDNWKPKYFLGLIYWSRNQLGKARELFAACGNRPDFAPFYAARAELIPESSVQDLLKAAELDPKQWRYGKLLIQHSIREKKYPEALTIAKDYDKRFPNDFRIRLLLAKTWLLNENYVACNDVLAKTQVLPYEGSTEGHALYHEAWLMQAIAAIKAKKYPEALTMIAKARLYPINLGVGKPYDENIDSRVEFFLEGMCHDGMKKPDKATTSWTAVVGQNHPPGINTLVTAWALRKQGKSPEGEKLLKNWASQAPGAVTQWCLDVYEGKAAAWEFGPEPDGSRVVDEMVVLVR